MRHLTFALLALALVPALGWSADPTVIDLKDDKPGAVTVEVEKGAIIRMSVSGAAGRVEIAATVDGKAAEMKNVRVLVGGKPSIGATIKELDLEAKSGPIKVVITRKDTVAGKTDTWEYTIKVKE